MIYLNTFTLPPRPEFIDTGSYHSGIPKLDFNAAYPLHVFVKKRLPRLEFGEITIFYGSNGSGKSTLLNVIGEKLKLKRETSFSTNTHFDAYVRDCTYTLQGRDNGRSGKIHANSRVIASDDIFDFLLAKRQENEIIQEKRDEVLDIPRPRVKSDASEPWQLGSLKDYPRFKQFYEFRTWKRSKLLQKYAGERSLERSNGQTALQYFIDSIKDGGLYLLDEPENSLSPKFQLELVDLLQDAARFYRCQLIIATHSPFVLSLKGARIYDLDATHDHAKPWTELENVRLYYDFFKKYEGLFKDRICTKSK